MSRSDPAVMERLLELVEECERLRSEVEHLRALNEELGLDHLTRVPNRATLSRMADAEFDRARRQGRRVAVIVMDVDHFKDVNDLGGHLEGDRVLQRVAEAASSRVRRSDAFGRWGGEEFVAVASSATLRGALRLAEEIRLAVERETTVTASLGVAMVDEDDESWEAALKRADRALYAAKAGGRNRVEAAR